jgi:hypothetical protein
MEIKKTCSKCCINKPLGEFINSNRNKDGKTANCKECEKNRKSEQYLKDKEKINKRNQIWRDNNKDKVKEQHIKYYNDNKDSISKRHKLYNKFNKEKIINYHKNYRLINKEKINLYFKNKLKIDPLYKLKCNIRTYIRLSFKRMGYFKKSNTEDILGCTFEELKQHIESKFESWMTWGNKGLYNGELNHGWDIDHVVPLSSAITEEDIVRLNHYTNLQPLCSYTNRYIKKDKY